MEVSTPAKVSDTEGAPPSPQRRKLPAPSTPTSSVRRKMASNAGSASKDAIPPRRPTAASGTATVGARRPAAASTATSSARASTASASKPTSSATSRASTVGSSLNKPPTRPVPGSAARRTGLTAKPTASDAEPELSNTCFAGEDDVAAVNCPLHHHRREATPDFATSCRSLDVTRHPARLTGLIHQDDRHSTHDDYAGSTRHHHQGTCWPREEALCLCASSTSTRACFRRSAASDAEVETRKFGPVKAALAKLGEETPRPDTAPSGPAEMDVETKRRSAQIMQDFFKETNLREQLQEQLGDLNREVDNLQTEKAKLRKQLAEAQAAIAEKDRAIAGGAKAGGAESEHTTLVDEMGKNLKLEEEKQAEATKAAELQQGREWDAEKKKLVEQAAEIAELTKEVATLKTERDALSSKLTEVQRHQTDELRSRDEKVEELSSASHDEALQESSALVDELQSKVTTLQQQHTEELQSKDETIESHLKAREELQTTADLDNERNAHAEALKKNVEELQKRAGDDLLEKEKEITKLQQGETEGTNLIKTEENDELLSADATELEQLKEETEGLRKTITTLEQLAKIRAELNNATQKAETYKAELDNTQEKHSQDLRTLGEDRDAEIESLRADLEGDAKKRLDKLQSECDSLMNASEERVQELEELKKELATLNESSGSASKDLSDALAKYKQAEEERQLADLEARVATLTKDAAAVEELQKPAQNAHDKSQTIITDLQSRHDSLLEDKTSAEDAHARALDALKQDSDSKYKQLLEKTAAEEAHGMSKTIIADLQARHDSLLEEKTAAEDAHTRALDALKEDSESATKQLLGTLQSNLEGAHKNYLDSLHDTHSKALDAQQAEIEQKYASLLDQEKAAALSDKQSALNELATLKKELQDEIDALRSELGSKEEAAVLAEKASLEEDHQAAIALLKEELKEQHEQALSELQSKYDAQQAKFATIEQEHSDAIELLKEEFKAGHSNDVQTLRQQLEAASMDQAHEEAISELMAGMESSQSDAATHAAHAAEIEALKQGNAEHQTGFKDLQSRHDKAVADVETHSQTADRLRQTIAEAAQEAEDRIETMKGEVVRKHLARVEPLEKQNAALSDKIERLEAIIAAGDRVARAAATLGEKRAIDTLAEEDEDEETTSDENTAPGAQISPKANGQPDVVVTQLAAMQETLNQLSDLNNDAIAESSRTAQRLTEQD
ncbi:hypothetical protein FB567DRAFT_564813 [Paraphoma chrysanthemicola]|uniref:Uncharacterized protein n=1 Tax=Paraphoma chrysanthemicola TaxID=798071 RepID=A0A8K0VS54_9PLEO|nr:hypothetical protein FB567DRAFT_564813 [Paraphoma chrysanthemicola]